MTVVAERTIAGPDVAITDGVGIQAHSNRVPPAGWHAGWLASTETASRILTVESPDPVWGRTFPKGLDGPLLDPPPLPFWHDDTVPAGHIRPVYTRDAEAPHPVCCTCPQVLAHLECHGTPCPGCHPPVHTPIVDRIPKRPT